MAFAAVKQAQPLEPHIDVVLGGLLRVQIGERDLRQLLDSVVREEFHRLFRYLDLPCDQMQVNSQGYSKSAVTHNS